VRIDDTSLFKKGTDCRWSDEVQVVQEARGKTVTLPVGTTHRRNKISMVQHYTVTASTPKTMSLKYLYSNRKTNFLLEEKV
jgi:hypothetical protein